MTRSAFHIQRENLLAEFDQRACDTCLGNGRMYSCLVHNTPFGPQRLASVKVCEPCGGSGFKPRLSIVS